MYYIRVFMISYKSQSISSQIIKPNKHSIDNRKLYKWLDNSDVEIKNIATEFIMKTTYISYSVFNKVIKKAFYEMLSILKTKTLQFYIASDNINHKFKSGFWVLKHIEQYIDKDKYDVKIIYDIDNIDFDIPVIIPDDATYSGSQINMFLEVFQNKNCDIYILIPFISNTAINVIKDSFEKYNINGNIFFVNKAKYTMVPIYELMEQNKIEKLFSYYSKDGKNIREYPIYFDHKVADNYSSFPLIYTYGIIPNKYNKNIIQNCKKNRLPFKEIFDKLERIPILKNCDINIEYNLQKPSCPLQPYKENFHKISEKTYSKRTV